MVKQNVCFYEAGCYTHGEYFMPHYDFRKSDVNIRLRTILVYISETTTGGELNFPILNASIFPTEFLIVSWLNYNMNNKPDFLSLHESFKILKGIKTVLTFFQYSNNDQNI